MNFADRILDGIEDLYDGVRAWTRQDHTQYFPIACPHTDDILALYNGSLMSVIRVKGYMGQYFPDQFADLRECWVDFLRNSYSSRNKSDAGFDIFWSYEFDPDGMKEEAIASRQRMIDAGKKRGLATEDILLEEAEIYGAICASEQQYLMVVTHIDSLEKADQVSALAERRRDIAGSAKGSGSMMLKAGVRALDALHEQHVNKVMTFMTEKRDDVGKQPYAIERMTARAALVAMRMSLMPAATSPRWNPRIKPSDMGYRATDDVKPSKQRLQRSDAQPNDWAFKLPPKLSHQMMEDAIDMGRYAQIGDRTYAPMYISETATSPVNIENFLIMCYQRRLPVRMVYSLMSNSSQANYWNRLFASVFSFASASNRQISKADNALKNYEEMGGTVLGFGLAVTTWSKTKVSYTADGSPLYDIAELQGRARDVETLLQQWGGQQVDAMYGCPVEAMMSATPGYAIPPVCPKAPQPEFDCVTQLPIMRPASLWDRELSMWFRTSDGVLVPHQPMSKKQNAMLTLIMGGMGYGKSNCIADHIFYFANHPQASEMAYIRGLDFGASSRGVVDLIYESLPADRKHEVLFKPFTNDGSMVKNMFDTRLCMRYPLAEQKKFQLSWLGMICDELLAKGGVASVMNILTAAIDKAYANRDPAVRQSQPSMFEVYGADPLVTRALNKIEFEADEQTYYWEAVDALAIYGATNNDVEVLHAAKIAQRQAVPKLGDLLLILDSLEDRFANNRFEDQSLVSAIASRISHANDLFPCMSGVTNIDISEARVCIFDMSDVFGRGVTPFDDWNRSMFFAVAMRLQTEDLFVNLVDTGDDLKRQQHALSIPDEVLAYHLKYLESQARIDKLFWADELHRVGRVQGALDIIDSMAFEGRKYQVGLMLGTQVPRHFPENMRDMASSFFVFGASQSAAMADEVQEILSLSNDERNAVLGITKPSPSKGAMVFAVFKTTEGVQRLLLHFQMGGIKRWAYATEADERALRGILYSKGPSPAWARRSLAKYVPDIQAAIKAKMKASANSSLSLQEAIEQIAAEQLQRQ